MFFNWYNLPGFKKLLYVLVYVSFPTNSSMKLLHYHHFRNEETEAYRGHMTSLKLHSYEDMPNQSDSEFYALITLFYGQWRQ